MVVFGSQTPTLGSAGTQPAEGSQNKGDRQCRKPTGAYPPDTADKQQSLALSLATCQISPVSLTLTAPPALEEIRAVVRSVCEDRGVARVDLFGSLARGCGSHGSDVDLLVEFLPGSNIGLFEMGALKEDLEQRLGCRVDLVSRRAVERSRNPIRRNAILSDPIPLYAR